MQPDFEHLVQFIRSVARTTPLEFIHVVLASSDGDVLFLEVEGNLAFRTQLQAASRQGFLALGLLGWKLTAGTIQAKSTLFPWHRTEGLLDLFQQLCEDGVESVREKLESRIRRP